MTGHRSTALRRGTIRRGSDLLPVAAQLFMAIACLAALLLMPRSDQPVLLIPLTAGAAAMLPRLALRGNVQLLGAGPIRGSLVISGDSAPRWQTLLYNAILPLAGNARLCGDTRLSQAQIARG